MRHKTGFSVVENDIKNMVLCLKMKAQIKGYLGQMAHRRQIAQWAGTRTTHPGGTGFETGTAQNWRVRVAIPAGAFYAPQNTPQGVSIPENIVFARKTQFSMP